MGLFEWLGESYNPGSVGSIDGPPRQPQVRRNGAVVLRALVALVVLGIFWWFVLDSLMVVTPLIIVLLLSFTIAYSVVGYYVRPRPDTTNMGWGGGLMDNPFRYSDDFNRSLVVFAILLFPGQFLAHAVVDLVRLMERSRR